MKLIATFLGIGLLVLFLLLSCNTLKAPNVKTNSTPESIDRTSWHPLNTDWDATAFHEIPISIIDDTLIFVRTNIDNLHDFDDRLGAVDFYQYDLVSGKTQPFALMDQFKDLDVLSIIKEPGTGIYYLTVKDKGKYRLFAYDKEEKNDSLSVVKFFNKDQPIEENWDQTILNPVINNDGNKISFDNF